MGVRERTPERITKCGVFAKSLRGLQIVCGVYKVLTKRPLNLGLSCGELDADWSASGSPMVE